MNVLQGRYFKSVNSDSGKLKGLQIKNDEGIQVVYLPKALRAIAQQELVVGDALRIWTTQRKKGSKSKKKGNASKSLWALQLIPLSPKAIVTQKFTEPESPISELPKPSQLPQKRSKKVKKAKKKKTAQNVTVQLCQKKNCCKRGGTQLWSAFESAQSTASIKPFQLEAVGCLGGCKNGPNIRFLPDNVKHYHVKPKDVDALLAKHR